MNNYIEDQLFQKIDGKIHAFIIAEYENCRFENCDLSESNISRAIFTSCKFENCNLSMALIKNTSFRNVQFKNCKLLGLHFDQCSDFLFEIHFENCVLNFTSFYKVKLKNSSFKNCTIHDADFTEADLSALNLVNCDLLNSKFERTILEKTDFRSAYNYLIDPEINRIKKARFSKEQISGLLGKFDISIE